MREKGFCNLYSARIAGRTGCDWMFYSNSQITDSGRGFGKIETDLPGYESYAIAGSRATDKGIHDEHDSMIVFVSEALNQQK